MPDRLAAQQRPGWQADPVGFEQLVMAYLQRPSKAAAKDDAQAAARPGPGTKAVTR